MKTILQTLRSGPRSRAGAAARRVPVRATVTLALLAAVVAPPVAADLVAQLPETEYEGAAALGLPLRRLGTTKRVLMIAAHPDDESTQILSTLALGDGADVAYLSLTRGEGGQNGIGAELREGLGLLRSEELLAARRLDGAVQFFTRAIDYGFSKSADEAFTQWPREELLADAVAVVRHFRPDVIVSVFSGTPRDGHGQHQAAGIIAAEAFRAAADPTRFPDQVAAGLQPHAAAHFYRLVRGLDEAPVARVEAGALDPLLGLSHFQVAMASRSRHRSQDMGRALTPGPQSTPLDRAASRVKLDDVDGAGVFVGVDTTLSARARGVFGDAADPDARAVLDLITRYEATVDDARRAFNPLLPQQIVPFLTEAGGYLRRIDDAIGGAREAEDLRFHLERQVARLDDALRRAARIEVDAVADDEAVVPGQTFTLELRFWNGGAIGVGLSALEPVLPAGWSATPRDPLPPTVSPGSLVTRRFDVAVPADAVPTEPYFLRLPRDGARYAWPSETGGIGHPFEPDEVRARAGFTVRDAPVATSISASYLGVDARSGEFRRPVRVVPGVAVEADPVLAVVPVGRSDRAIHVSTRIVAEEPDGVAGTLRITAPSGWRVEPASVDLRFEAPGEERVVEFDVTPPAGVAPGRFSLGATFEDDAGRGFDRGYHLVDYPHVRPRPLYRTATVDVQAIDVAVPEELSVAYVAAAGDGVPAALAQLGIALDPLDAEDLASAPLDGYDVIVIGSRAYEGRPDLVTHNRRLLDYVERGGTMIVQYNRYAYTEPGIAPYPVAMARPHDRVTDENAAVLVLRPDHQVFNWPNRITDEDFDGWVQERGLYFLNTWDERYTPLLEMADPGESPNRGILMVTEHGAGTYVYTGLALFRQLPVGVPGAFRLFANLLALGADR